MGGRAVEPNIYKNTYYKGTLTNDAAECILSLRNESCMPAIKNSIYVLADYQVTELIEAGDAYIKEHKTLKGFDYKPAQPYDRGELRDEQTIGTAFMFFAGSALLGDEVGLGKTVETAALCNLVENVEEQEGKNFSFCFLTENPTVPQIWKKMIKFTGKYVSVLTNAEKPRVDAWIEQNKNGQCVSLVGPHSLLNNAAFILYCARHPFSVFIIDESAILKNSSTDTYKNAKALLQSHKRRIMLNATPLETELRDFYNQLVLLDDFFMPSVTSFTKDYCTTSMQGGTYKVTGTKNEGIFKTAISLRYLARTRKGLGATYKGNTSKILVLEPSPLQKKMVQKNSLYQLIYDYPPDVDKHLVFDMNDIPKMRAVMEIMDGIYKKSADEGKLFIYCRFINCQLKLQELLAERGYTSVIYNGQTKAKEKARILQEFNGGMYDVMITNVKRGLDLNICNHCIMYTIDPNPQKMVQAEGRMTREFDVFAKHVYILAMRGKEEDSLNMSIKDRVVMAQKLTVTGNSMVMDAIMSDNERSFIDYYSK